jgi:iron-sulfur cluster assembly protein
MEYTIDLVREPIAADDVVEIGGGKVFVNPEATLFLLGTEMDFEVTTLRTGFVFRNPNQTSACGCGESVEIRPASPEHLAEARG